MTLHLPAPPAKEIVDLVGVAPVLLMFVAQALAADRLWFATNLAFAVYHVGFTRLWSLALCSAILLGISGYRAFVLPRRRTAGPSLTLAAARRALAAYGRAHLELEEAVGHVPQLDAVRKQHLDAVATALGERS